MADINSCHFHACVIFPKSGLTEDYRRTGLTGPSALADMFIIFILRIIKNFMIKVKNS